MTFIPICTLLLKTIYTMTGYFVVEIRFIWENRKIYWQSNSNSWFIATDIFECSDVLFNAHIMSVYLSAMDIIALAANI